jgi:hypothetical protein
MAHSLDEIKTPGEVRAGAPGSLEFRELAHLREEAEVASLRQDTAARKTYAERIYRLAVAWLSAVLLILLLEGFQFNFWASLPENVLIALVVGSTTGVLGILASVIAYIFRVQK